MQDLDGWVESDGQQRSLSEDVENRIKKWIAESLEVTIDDELGLTDYEILLINSITKRDTERFHVVSSRPKNECENESRSFPPYCFAGILRMLMK